MITKQQQQQQCRRRAILFAILAIVSTYTTAYLNVHLDCHGWWQGVTFFLAVLATFCCYVTAFVTGIISIHL